MAKKKLTDRASSNFRQQDSTARKLENDVNTEAHKQFTQTGATLEGAAPEKKSQSKLQKQNANQTDHVTNEFRQRDSTANKIDRVLHTEQQQQFTQSSSQLNDATGSSQGKLKSQFSDNQSSIETSNSNANKSKLQKKFSSESQENFRQQENTASKIDRVLHTEQQQQFTQSSSQLNGNTGSNQGKLRGQFSTDSQDRSDGQKSNTNKSKLQKKFSSEAKENFKQQEKYKLNKEMAKGALISASDSVKSGLQKYQGELEKDDEAVKFTSQGASHIAKLSTSSVRKLKEKRLESINFKKAKQNPLYKESPKKSSLKKIASTPVTVLKSGSLRYQGELEKDDEGVKLASQSATQISRASKKLKKGVGKINAQSGKLGKQNSKLTQFHLKKDKKLKSQTKATLKKKAMKKKMYAPIRKNRAAAGLMSGFSNRMSNMVKTIAKFNRMLVTKALGAKAAAVLGSGLAAVLPIIIVAALVLVLVGILGGTSEQNQTIGAKNLSPEVEQWRALVETEAAAQGMEKYVGLVLAIIQVESGGKGTRDIMQSSESAGHPRNYWSTEAESVRQGIKHLKNIVNIVSPFGLENNFQLLAQAYNFGSAFANYVVNLGGSYSIDVAEQYSKTIVAPSLGNHTGEKYSYVNSVSKRLGKTYLYRNGGNFMYGDLVSEYLGGAGGAITGEFGIVVAELEKYLGWSYVWGGKNPSTGFDCSGFVSWGLSQIGVSLPSYAASQYDLTVPIDASQAQPGDLIFFKGTYGGANHVSHVGFYIDENTMLDSNGSGVGYHNWKDPYWQKHYAGIRRIAGK